MLRVQEVFPGNAHVQGIQVDNSYISLPGELFKNLKESGMQLYANMAVCIHVATCVIMLYFATL